MSLPLLVDRAIPVRVRKAINIESRLNDGIATPFVTLFLAVVVAEQASAGQHWLIDTAIEIALAIVVAIAAGGIGGRVTARARRRGWASPASGSLAVVSLAVLAYAGATTIGGNGFVAAFTAGIFYRTATAAAEPSVESADWIGASLTLIRVVTWTVLMSIFLHRLSAGPIGALYGRRVAMAPTGTWELGEADEPQLRHRLMTPERAAAGAHGRVS